MVGARLSYDAAGADIKIGDRTYIGRSHLVTAAGITIGDDVLISWGVTIADHDSHSRFWEDRKTDVLDWGRGKHKNWNGVAIGPVRIGDKAWIGFGASILKNVVIGEGAIIAAQSVVTKDVPAWTLVAGNPAKVIREVSRSDPARDQAGRVPSSFNADMWPQY